MQLYIPASERPSRPEPPSLLPSVPAFASTHQCSAARQRLPLLRCAAPRSARPRRGQLPSAARRRRGLASSTFCLRSLKRTHQRLRRKAISASTAVCAARASLETALKALGGGALFSGYIYRCSLRPFSAAVMCCRGLAAAPYRTSALLTRCCRVRNSSRLSLTDGSFRGLVSLSDPSVAAALASGAESLEEFLSVR